MSASVLSQITAVISRFTSNLATVIFRSAEQFSLTDPIGFKRCLECGPMNEFKGIASHGVVFYL